MGETKQINIKNRSYYLYRNLIDLKDFDAGFLKIGKKWYKNIYIYYIGYSPFIKIGDYCSNFTVNPLYLDIIHANGYIEGKSENKYLVLDNLDEDKEVFKKYEEVWEGIKKEIETINGGKRIEYGKDLKKNKSNSDDGLPLNRLLKFRNTTIIRCVFSEDGKFYHQLFLDDTLYELV